MISKSSLPRLAVITLFLMGVTLPAPAAYAQAGYRKGPAAPWVGKTAEGQKCTGGQPTAGPWDYLQRRKWAGPLASIEEHHFNRNVELLIRGISTEPMGDIDFTLRAFPNHHRALTSAVNFRVRNKRWPQTSKGRQAECYLQRAIAFSPKDPTLHPLLAHVLHRLNKPTQALVSYRKAIADHPRDVMLKYNMGLALTDIKQYKQASRIATEIYAADFPLPALKRRLVAAGEWKEPPAKAEKEGSKPGQAEGANKSATDVGATADTTQNNEAGEESSPAEEAPQAQPDEPEASGKTDITEKEENDAKPLES